MELLSIQGGLFVALSFILFSVFTAWTGRRRNQGEGGAHGRRNLLFLVSIIYLTLAGGLTGVFWFALSAVSVWAGALFIEAKRGYVRGSSLFVYRLVLIFNFALLAVFAYADFPGYTIEEFYRFRGLEYEWEPLKIAAPLAVSYYTLTLTGYLMDVKNGRIRADKSLINILLFGGFFPEMSTGPIARYGRLKKTLFPSESGTAHGSFNGSGVKTAAFWNDFSFGAERALFGLFKKIVIAERLGAIVDTVYGEIGGAGGSGAVFAGGEAAGALSGAAGALSGTDGFSGFFVVFAAVCFTLQLYADFSGSSDIAIGLGQMFGARLDENFRQPFFSRSVAEFWRRWHITLGSWARDYIYIPLGGNRRGIPRQILNTFAVWLFTGLWHGGKWTYIVGVGILQAVLMSASIILKPVYDRFYSVTGLDRDNGLVAFLQRIRTFLIMTAAFVFFRAGSLYDSLGIFAAMLRKSDAGSAYAMSFSEFIEYAGLDMYDMAVLAVSLLVLFAISLRKERAEAGRGDADLGSAGAVELEAESGFRDTVAREGSGTGRGVPEAKCADTGTAGVGAGGPLSGIVSADAYESSGKLRKNDSFVSSVTRRLLICFIILFIIVIFGVYGFGYDASGFIYAQF